MCNNIDVLFVCTCYSLRQQEYWAFGQQISRRGYVPPSCNVDQGPGRGYIHDMIFRGDGKLATASHLFNVRDVINADAPHHHHSGLDMFGSASQSPKEIKNSTELLSSCSEWIGSSSQPFTKQVAASSSFCAAGNLASMQSARLNNLSMSKFFQTSTTQYDSTVTSESVQPDIDLHARIEVI